MVFRRSSATHDELAQKCWSNTETYARNQKNILFQANFFGIFPSDFSSCPDSFTVYQFWMEEMKKAEANKQNPDYYGEPCMSGYDNYGNCYDSYYGSGYGGDYGSYGSGYGSGSGGKSGYYDNYGNYITSNYGDYYGNYDNYGELILIFYLFPSIFG